MKFDYSVSLEDIDILRGSNIKSRKTAGDLLYKYLKIRISADLINGMTKDPEVRGVLERFKVKSSSIDVAVYDVLCGVARRGEVITYRELWEAAGFTVDDHWPWVTELSDCLYRIGLDEWDNNRPLLSVLVVLKESGIPGSGFGNLVAAVGGGIDIVVETKRCYEYWKNK